MLFNRKMQIKIKPCVQIAIKIDVFHNEKQNTKILKKIK